MWNYCTLHEIHLIVIFFFFLVTMFRPSTNFMKKIIESCSAALSSGQAAQLGNTSWVHLCLWLWSVPFVRTCSRRGHEEVPWSPLPPWLKRWKRQNKKKWGNWNDIKDLFEVFITLLWKYYSLLFVCRVRYNKSPFWRRFQTPTWIYQFVASDCSSTLFSVRTLLCCNMMTLRISLTY